MEARRFRPWRTDDANWQPVKEPPPLTYPHPTQHLRNAASRLAAELEEAELFQASAYASMVVDAIDQRGDGTDANGKDMRTDIELKFELDEHGRVWMVREGDCHIIGRKDAVCAEMRRFLAAVMVGDKR